MVSFQPSPKVDGLLWDAGGRLGPDKDRLCRGPSGAEDDVVVEASGRFGGFFR